MQIYVLSAAAKQFTLEIENSSSTIENVKNVIKNKEEGKELPMDELDLVFQGTILEEGRMLSYYNIQDGSTLNMAFQLGGERIQVIVRDLIGKTYRMEIGESDTLDDLKKKIEDVVGYPSSEQRLVFMARIEEGVILDQMRLIQSRLLESGDQERIAEMYKHNARARPTIHAVPRLRGGGNVVHHPVKWADASSSPPKRSSTTIKIGISGFINVLSAAAKHFTLEIENASTIENVKNVIKNKEEGKEIPMDELDLVFQGTILEDGRMLSYYNIQDGSTLNTAFQLRGETVQVILKSLTREEICTIEIGESHIVEDLKKKIEDLLGIPSDQQRLLFFAERLKEGVILDQMRLIQSKVLESGDQDTIDAMYKDNARPTITMEPLLRGAGNVVHHRVECADGSSSPPKRSSTAIKIAKDFPKNKRTSKSRCCLF